MRTILNKGDTVGIISPCSFADKSEYKKIIAGINALGLKTKEGKNLYKNTYGYAATEEERAEDVNALFADPEVQMVFFGGGNVGSEILDLVDFELIKRNPKLVCSASNGTTLLNMIYAKTGLPVYYGMFPNAFASLSAFDSAHFKNAFMHDSNWEFEQSSEWQCVQSGTVRGTLIGGFSTLFPYFFGSRHFSYDKTKKYILFLENHPVFIQTEEIEAQLDFIAQSGFMECVSGLVFGTFSDDKAQADVLLGILERFCRKYHIAGVKCDDFGHGARHGIIPIGLDAVLDAQSCGNCRLYLE